MDYTNPYDTGNITSSELLHGNLREGLLNIEFMPYLNDGSELYLLTGAGAARKKKTSTN